MAVLHDTWCEVQNQAINHEYLRKARKELQKQVKQVCVQRHRPTKEREYPLLRIALRNSYIEKENMIPVRQGNAIILAPKKIGISLQPTLIPTDQLLTELDRNCSNCRGQNYKHSRASGHCSHPNFRTRRTLRSDMFRPQLFRIIPLLETTVPRPNSS
jgi:hypothetical protein